jgi:hypothetical protein
MIHSNSSNRPARYGLCTQRRTTLRCASRRARIYAGGLVTIVRNHIFGRSLSKYAHTRSQWGAVKPDTSCPSGTKELINIPINPDAQNHDLTRAAPTRPAGPGYALRGDSTSLHVSPHWDLRQGLRLPSCSITALARSSSKYVGHKLPLDAEKPDISWFSKR